ncbi:MAG TPA: methyltransferase domain-containing protein [Acidimicrobiia bacterium]|nr:methyltransferase domain-containing protein [Acidimicrobiia bacterium]
MTRRFGRRGAAMNEADARAFVDDCYRRLLGRPADPDGLRTYVALLRAGTSPAEIAMLLATSDEHRHHLLASALPRKRRPDHYRLALDLSGTQPFLAFDVRDASDFDWLEAAIIDGGYYEQPGVWSLEVDDDKRVMAQLLADLRPRRALELGCSTGAVIGELVARGVDAYGVEISRMAHDRASAALRERIHVGDLLTLELREQFDLVFGLDIFEHLNPNRFDDYVERLAALVEPDGWLVANIPAFGRDEVFGEVFPLYVASWDDDVAAGQPFRVLHCDDDGYPMNGHLIWAHTAWWVQQFSKAGFTRQPDVEHDVQARYGSHFDAHPARRSTYVFRRSA